MSYKIKDEIHKAVSFELIYTDSRGREHKVKQPEMKHLSFEILITDNSSADDELFPQVSEMRGVKCIT